MICDVLENFLEIFSRKIFEKNLLPAFLNFLHTFVLIATGGD